MTADLISLNKAYDHILSSSSNIVSNVHFISQASDHMPIIATVKLSKNIAYDFDGSLKIYVNICRMHIFTIFLRGFSILCIENFAKQNVRKYMKMRAFSYIFQNGKTLFQMIQNLF